MSIELENHFIYHKNFGSIRCILNEEFYLKNEQFRLKRLKDPVTYLQFDDLITKEKTKMKPLSITVAVDANSREILQANVSQIPASGHLAQKSQEKYGKRKSMHNKALEKTFEKLKDIVHPFSKIKSDEHSYYGQYVRRYFPYAKYEQFKSERGCIAGQGELKKVKFDPIFTINHTMAMMRAGISTLVRKTWAVTQDPKRLQGHLEIYMYYYNHIYLKKTRST